MLESLILMARLHCIGPQAAKTVKLLTASDLFWWALHVNQIYSSKCGNYHFYIIIYLLVSKETTPTVINWQDYEGRSALHLAVADGNEEIVQALVRFQFFQAHL